MLRNRKRLGPRVAPLKGAPNILLIRLLRRNYLTVHVERTSASTANDAKIVEGQRPREDLTHVGGSFTCAKSWVPSLI